MSKATLSLYAQISLREDIDLSAASFQSVMGSDTLNVWICESLKEIFNLRLLNIFECFWIILNNCFELRRPEFYLTYLLNFPASFFTRQENFSKRCDLLSLLLRLLGSGRLFRYLYRHVCQQISANFIKEENIKN